MANFLLPPLSDRAHYVLDSSGALTAVKIPLGGKSVVYLWGGDNQGRGLRVNAEMLGTGDGDVVSAENFLVTVREEDFFRAVAPWTFSWGLRGNRRGNGWLVAKAVDDSVYARISFEVTALEIKHRWTDGGGVGVPQPAPLTMWFSVKHAFPRVRFSGITQKPGHEDHSEGRAVDLGLSASIPFEARFVDDLIGLLTTNSNEIGWSFFIWDRQIWYSDQRGGPNPYTRSCPHRSHIHISWSRENSQRCHFPSLIAGLRAFADPAVPN